MKRILIAALVVLCGLIHAQQIGYSDHAYYALDAGVTQFRPWQQNENGLAITRTNQLFTYGISLNAPAGGRYREYSDANFSLHMLYADNIESFQDSTTMSARGWELMTSLFAWDLLRHEDFDLVVGPGMYWGNLKLISRANNSEFDYHSTNVFIAPMARVDFRYCIGLIVFGARCSYRYDISKGDWSRSASSSPTFPAYRFRDVQYLAYVGFCVRDTK